VDNDTPLFSPEGLCVVMSPLNSYSISQESLEDVRETIAGAVDIPIIL
jgi:hypothetical protein